MAGVKVLSAAVLVGMFGGIWTATTELLRNGGFEAGASNWDHCWGFQCEITSDSHSGTKAMKATGRTMYYQGPTQTVQLEMGKMYSVGGWVKLLNDNDKPVQHVEIEVSETLSGGKKNYISVARRPFLSTKSGWVHLAGDFVTPASGLTSVSVYLQGPDPGISFIVDDMSLSEIPKIANWKPAANNRIEKLRKGDIQFHVTGGNQNPNNVQLEINQTSSAFAFGTAIDCNKITSSEESFRKYTQFIYDYFEWATPANALKWYEFERNKGNINWNWGESALKELVKRGIKIRAHNMLWGIDPFVPSWLKTMSPDQVRQEVTRHVKETTLRYKGMVEHWDVNNELLHGNWFENKLNDTEFTKDVFRQMYKWDPNVKLFLNEYNTVGSGGTTEAYTQQGMDYKKSNTHIYGMGVQSHFPNSVAPDPTIMMKRLDRLAEAGLPLWSTELTVRTTDVDQRADWLETAMRVLFSHPSMEGIIIWGVWSLVDGQDLKTNAAGKRYINLVKHEWRTNLVRSLSDGNSFNLRGFLGDYKVNVRVNGKIIKTQTFTLGKGGQTVNINLS